MALEASDESPEKVKEYRKTVAYTWLNTKKPEFVVEMPSPLPPGTVNYVVLVTKP